jgi:hypothetical protein
MAIGTPAAGDLVVYSSPTLGRRGLGIVRSVSGSDVLIDDPAEPKVTPSRIAVVDLIARYAASGTRP